MMNDPARSGQAARPAEAGLCASCVHARTVTSSRGSRFLLCRLSAVDPWFPRYPVLPVRACGGYRPDPASGMRDAPSAGEPEDA
jgi:hypothetical protein